MPRPIRTGPVDAETVRELLALQTQAPSGAPPRKLPQGGARAPALPPMSKGGPSAQGAPKGAPAGQPGARTRPAGFAGSSRTTPPPPRRPGLVETTGHASDDEPES